MGKKQTSITKNYGTFMHEFNQTQVLMIPPTQERISSTLLMTI